MPDHLADDQVADGLQADFLLPDDSSVQPAGEPDDSGIAGSVTAGDSLDWCRALGLDAADIPSLVVLEGSWWRQERNALRLARLDGARELAFPEFHLGRRPGDGLSVAYSCVYGAARAVEPIHVYAQLGRPTVVQIGSCGSLQPQVRTGDIVLAETAAIGEGASQYYGGEGLSRATPDLVDQAEAAFHALGFTVHRGAHVTTSALFAQPPERVAAWSDAGYLAVDMETSAVFSAAQHFGLPAVSLLFVWDELLAGRSFLHPYTAAEQAAQTRANLALMDVALGLVFTTGGHEGTATATCRPAATWPLGTETLRRFAQAGDSPS